MAWLVNETARSALTTALSPLAPIGARAFSLQPLKGLAMDKEQRKYLLGASIVTLFALACALLLSAIAWSVDGGNPYVKALLLVLLWTGWFAIVAALFTAPRSPPPNRELPSRQ